MSESVSEEYKEIVELHDREFQKFSIDNQIYCVPVDEVSAAYSFDPRKWGAACGFLVSSRGPGWNHGGQDMLVRSSRVC